MIIIIKPKTINSGGRYNHSLLKPKTNTWKPKRNDKVQSYMARCIRVFVTISGVILKSTSFSSSWATIQVGCMKTDA